MPDRLDRQTVPRGQRDRPAPLEGLREPPDLSGHSVPPGLRVQRVQPVTRVYRVTKALRGRLVLRGQLDPLDTPVVPVLRELLDTPEQRVQPEQAAAQSHPRTVLP